MVPGLPWTTTCRFLVPGNRLQLTRAAHPLGGWPKAQGYNQLWSIPLGAMGTMGQGPKAHGPPLGGEIHSREARIGG